MLVAVDGLVVVDDLLGIHVDVFSIKTSLERFTVDLSFIYGVLTFFSLFMGVSSSRFQNKREESS